MPKFAQINLSTFLCNQPMPKNAEKCRFLPIFDFANVQQNGGAGDFNVQQNGGAGDLIAIRFSRFLEDRLTD